jgi:hypothetical protein
VEVVSTPFGSVFASMPVKHSEESLPAHPCKIEDEGVRIFHRPPFALLIGHAHVEIAILVGGFLIQVLRRSQSRQARQDDEEPTP